MGARGEHRVDGRTPGHYLVREELQREGLRGRRAWEFERKLSEGKRNRLVRVYWEGFRKEKRD